MNQNIKIAKELVKIAKALVAVGNDYYDDGTGYEETSPDGMNLGEIEELLWNNLRKAKNTFDFTFLTEIDVEGENSTTAAPHIIFSDEDHEKMIFLGAMHKADMGMQGDGYTWGWQTYGMENDEFHPFGTFKEAFDDLKKNESRLDDALTHYK